jgi:CRP-like cAMP-binding protein
MGRGSEGPVTKSPIDALTWLCYDYNYRRLKRYIPGVGPGKEEWRMANTYVLEQVDIFMDLTPEQLSLIDDICSDKTFMQGEVVFEENSPSREFYVIMDGEVEIQVDPDTIGDGSADNYQPSTIAVL